MLQRRLVPLSSGFVVRSSRGFSNTSGKGGDNDWWGGDSSQENLFNDEELGPTPEKANIIAPVRRSSLFTSAPQRRLPVVEGTPKLTLSEALFLAKEAGIYTTREVQTHIIKSPSFSVDKQAPFLLENFFSSAGEPAEEPYSAELVGGVKPLVAPSSGISSGEQKKNYLSEKSSTLDVIPQSVHDFLIKGSKNPVFTFGARGREWLVRSQGKGTRKRSVAHVVLERGSGIVKVNGEEDLYKRWPLLSNRFDVLYPFEACGAAGLFDVYIRVRGGGISGQAGAARLAIGRALVAACSEVESDFKDTLILHEDTRQKTSKFPGKPGAYARRNWTLR